MSFVKKELVFTNEQIAERVQSLATMISNDYAGKELVLLGNLTGVFIFMADLVRKMTIPVKVDFVRTTSYGPSLQPGEIRLVEDIELSLEGTDVLIVEDIIDTGSTLDYLKKRVEMENPASIKICVLVDKSERRKTSVNVDYVGFELDNGFIVGYGLNYRGHLRELPQIYRLIF